jgi:hypothetical protein
VSCLFEPTSELEILTCSLPVVKWAIEGRRKLAKPTSSPNDKDLQRGASTNPCATAQNLNDHPRTPQLPVQSETLAHPSRTAELDRLHYESDAALAKSTETDGDRALRRIQAEEMASSLRDDKLLSSTGQHIHRHASLENQSQLPLTQENMQRLEKEADPGGPNPNNRDSKENDNSTTVEARSRSTSMVRHSPVVTRPSLLDARARDSEQTVVAKSRT